MRVDDAYLKVVLTVIAICLLWLCVSPIVMPVDVQAQTPGRVYIAGWIDRMGQPVGFTHRMGNSIVAPGVPVVTYSQP